MERKFKIFVVGGHVRDLFMGQPSKDMDFVVVGATEADLHDWGAENGFTFKQVGADFPVFIDNEGNEWALARKERKVGVGYKGFECDFDPTVTLVDDLFRRDLTINAMAMEVLEFSKVSVILDNPPVDPFGGLEDIKNGVLRHVSKHFVEDPVRVLRLARFAARFNGFAVAPETQSLVQKMCDAGELDHLVPERVWTELEKVLSTEARASRFVEVLAQTDAIECIFPGLDRNTTRTSLAAMDKITCGVAERFAAMIGMFHPMECDTFCNMTVKLPKDVAVFATKWSRLMFTIAGLHMWHQQPTADQVINIFENFDVFRDKEFLARAQAVSAGFDNPDAHLFLQGLTELAAKARAVGFDDLTEMERSQQGPAIGESIRKLRMEVISRELRNGTQLVLN